MKLFTGYLLIACLAITFFSCQHEPDIILGNDPPPPAAVDSTLMTMYIELDTTLPSGLDTTYKVTFTYDDHKRVKSYSASFDSFFERGEYVYSGNDTLPYKWTSEWSEITDTYRDTVYLSYTNGLVSYDSLTEYNITTGEFYGIEVGTYTVTGNNVFIQRRKYDLPFPSPVSFQGSGTISTTRQNGNITVEDDNSADPIGPDRRHYLVSYDNKPNPFFKTEIPYPILNKFIVQRNNTVTEKSWDFPASLESNYQSAYTYRADGYPVILRMTSIIQSPPSTIKGLFFYSH